MEKGEMCDYCGQAGAVLYCRADSARLCLSCDRQVHAANALSLKHPRSDLCHNCRAAPASTRCATDDLALCPDCDSDTHASSSLASSHRRLPLPPFSGCPSPLLLAARWDFNLDLAANPTHLDEMLKRRGRQRQLVYLQLLDLLRQDLGCVAGGEGVPDFFPSTSQPPVYDDMGTMDQGMPFTSLLMLPGGLDLQGEDRLVEGDDFLWDCNVPTPDQTAQVPISRSYPVSI